MRSSDWSSDVCSSDLVTTRSAFEKPIDATVRRLSAITPAKYHEGVNLFEIGDHGLGAFFHRHEIDAKGTPVERGIYYQLDGEGRIDRTVHGTSEEVFGPRNDDAQIGRAACRESVGQYV